MWAAFCLKGETFARFESYIAHYLERGNVASYDPIIIKVVDTVGYYLEVFSQLFGDLDEIKTAELRLLKLV
jgi:hypothetical protein